MKPAKDYSLLRPVFPDLKKFRDELEQWQEEQQLLHILSDRFTLAKEFYD